MGEGGQKFLLSLWVKLPVVVNNLLITGAHLGVTCSGPPPMVPSRHKVTEHESEAPNRWAGPWFHLVLQRATELESGS